MVSSGLTKRSTEKTSSMFIEPMLRMRMLGSPIVPSGRRPGPGMIEIEALSPDPGPVEHGDRPIGHFPKTLARNQAVDFTASPAAIRDLDFVHGPSLEHCLEALEELDAVSQRALAVLAVRVLVHREPALVADLAEPKRSSRNSMK